MCWLRRNYILLIINYWWVTWVHAGCMIPSVATYIGHIWKMTLKILWGSDNNACRTAERSERTKICLLKLFPETGPLEFLSIYILGSIPKNLNGSQLIVIRTTQTWTEHLKRQKLLRISLNQYYWKIGYSRTRSSTSSWPTKVQSLLKSSSCIFSKSWIGSSFKPRNTTHRRTCRLRGRKWRPYSG